MIKTGHYKILVKTPVELSQIRGFLATERAAVTSYSEIFNFVAADNLSDDIKRRLADMDAEVIEDISYGRD